MSSTESQPRLIAAKFAGQRGYQFTEWAKEFLDAAAGKGDEDASWADCYLGQDPQAGLNAAQLRRRTQRRRESYSALLQHMDDDSIAISLSSESMKAASSSTAMPLYEFQTSWNVAAAQASSKDSYSVA